MCFEKWFEMSSALANRLERVNHVNKQNCAGFSFLKSSRRCKPFCPWLETRENHLSILISRNRLCIALNKLYASQFFKAYIYHIVDNIDCAATYVSYFLIREAAFVICNLVRLNLVSLWPYGSLNHNGIIMKISYVCDWAICVLYRLRNPLCAYYYIRITVVVGFFCFFVLFCFVLFCFVFGDSLVFFFFFF